MGELWDKDLLIDRNANWHARLVRLRGQAEELAGGLRRRGLAPSRGREAQEFLEVGAQADRAEHVDEHHGAVRRVRTRQVPVCYVLLKRTREQSETISEDMRTVQEESNTTSMRTVQEHRKIPLMRTVEEHGQRLATRTVHA